MDKLAAIVKAGSPGGNWGNIPMPASPVADVKTVITRILTHK